jgi:IS605 OrfB family transposase
MRLHNKIDTMRRHRLGNAEPKAKATWRRRLLRSERKVCDLVGNLHNQFASTASRTYQHILLPKFQTHQMLQGQLHSSTKRMMQSLSFYQFQLKLKQLCEERGSRMHLVNEAHTTQTCGGCGLRNQKVGSAKVYRCPGCAYELDRDVHGGRNILIRNLTLLMRGTCRVGDLSQF